jgi:hypothetical protein
MPDGTVFARLAQWTFASSVLRTWLPIHGLHACVSNFENSYQTETGWASSWVVSERPGSGVTADHDPLMDGWMAQGKKRTGARQAPPDSSTYALDYACRPADTPRIITCVM